MEYFVDMAIISSFSSFLFLGLAFYSSFSDLVNVTAEEETEVEEKLRMAKRKGHREDRRTGREPMIAISPRLSRCMLSAISWFLWCHLCLLS
ncbi:hypothetical protein CUMW_007720 [Citrus unshiu]|nr:hypothetical protein CUMW_007720 [Citrus unshiu]